MSFLKSVIFGAEGSYNILGFDVSFKKNDSPRYSFAASTCSSGILSIFTKSIGYLADSCLNSKVFHVITQGYAHTFVHEMGHALAFKALTNLKPKVSIYTDFCGGNNNPGSLKSLSPKILSSIYVAGPMANMAFSSCKLVGAIALRAYLPMPVVATIGVGAVIWMIGELFLAYTSASNNDRGDFGRIARHGSNHLVLASVALVGQCVLGILAARRFI